MLAAGAGCEPYVEGNGVLREETRAVPEFEGVRGDDGIQVVVTAGAPQGVTVSGDENVLAHVETAVRQDPQHGAVLEVKSPWPIDSRNQLRVLVSVPELRFLGAARQSRVAASAVQADAFAVVASDGAVVELAGAGGRSLSVQLSAGQHGGATLDARGYTVQEATVALVSGSRAKLRVTGTLSGSATGGSAVENEGGAICSVTPPEAAQCGP